MVKWPRMITTDTNLAAFLYCLRVAVKKTDATPTFDCDIAADDPLVAQYASPDGYNMNACRFIAAIAALVAMPVYVPPEPPPEA